MSRQVIIGIFVAPLAASLALWFVMYMYGGSEVAFWEATWWLTFMLPAAYGCSLLFGIPVHLALRHYNLTRLWNYAVAGLLIGLTPAFAVWIVDRSSESFGIISILTGFGAALGPIAAIVFWMIAVRRYEPHPEP